MDQCWQLSPIALVLPKTGSLSTQFNKKVWQLLEAGIINKWMKDHGATNEKAKLAPEVAVAQKMSLADLNGAFYLLTGLYLLALVVFALELVVFQCSTLYL